MSRSTTTPRSSDDGTRTLGTASFESRVEQSVERLLELLSDRFARATFFVLGEIATQRIPRIVRKIAARGARDRRATATGTRMSIA